MDKVEALEIANEVYPKIVKHFGKNNTPIPTIEVHNSIYARLTGEEDAEGEQDPSAEFDRDENKMFIYYPNIPDKEELIRALVHEYTHYLQDGEKMKQMYKDGYTYQNHPYELEAIRSEEKWYIFA